MKNKRVQSIILKVRFWRIIIQVINVTIQGSTIETVEGTVKNQTVASDIPKVNEVNKAQFAPKR